MERYAKAALVVAAKIFNYMYCNSDTSSIKPSTESIFPITPTLRYFWLEVFCFPFVGLAFSPLTAHQIRLILHEIAIELLFLSVPIFLDSAFNSICVICQSIPMSRNIQFEFEF